MHQKSSLIILCTILCAGLLVTTAGCTGKTTYLDPTDEEKTTTSSQSSQVSSATTSTTEGSSAASAEGSTAAPESKQESSNQASAPAESSAAASSAAESSTESSAAQQSSAPAAVTVDVPVSIDSVSADDKKLIDSKEMSSALSGASADSSHAAKFIPALQSVLDGNDGRVVVSILSPNEEDEGYAFSMTDRQNSGDSVYIISSFEDDFAGYELAFLQKSGSTYEIDESSKTYFEVGNNDINTEPYKEITQLTTRFSTMSEGGTCSYNGSAADYEKYEGGGKVLLVYLSGNTVLGGEIYDQSSGKLQSKVYAELSKSIDSTHTSLPSDYKNGSQ